MWGLLSLMDLHVYGKNNYRWLLTYQHEKFPHWVSLYHVVLSQLQRLATGINRLLAFRLNLFASRYRWNGLTRLWCALKEGLRVSLSASVHLVFNEHGHDRFLALKLDKWHFRQDALVDKRLFFERLSQSFLSSYDSRRRVDFDQLIILPSLVLLSLR